MPERDTYKTWLEEAAYKELKLVRPDIVIVLQINPQIISKLNKQKKQRKYLKVQKEDIAEKDIKHQAEAQKEYLRWAKINPTWTIINCMHNNALKSINTIHQEIVKILEENHIL